MRGRLKSYFSLVRSSRYWPILRWPYYAVAVFICFVLLAVFGNSVVMPLVTRHGSEFPTPSVVGKSLREAEGLLKAAGLRIDIESHQHSPAVPEGVILDQMPRPQAMVKKNRQVKVVVSAGARMTVVPFLRGYTPRQVQLMLEETGLALGGESYVRDDSLPAGVVVSAIPAAGGSVPVGTVVNIFINETDEFSLTTVPILVGENIKKAEAMLDQRGLVLGAVFREVDAVLLPGTVVRQSIAAGEQVRRGMPVDLTITKESW